MLTPHEISSHTVNRLSLYLQCLRRLQQAGVKKVSSKDLASRFHLSATQIRKDLAQFGEFGIRGVGYEVEALADHLSDLLGLDRRRGLVIVGVGNLGSALSRYFGFNHGNFGVVAGVDIDPRVVGRRVGSFVVRHSRELNEVVAESGAEIGVLTVPGRRRPGQLQRPGQGRRQGGAQLRACQAEDSPRGAPQGRGSADSPRGDGVSAAGVGRRVPSRPSSVGA